MGNFFSSVQILNLHQPDKELFLDWFCDRMQKDGYITGAADDHEIAYCLSFADDCKWVAVGSERWNQNDIRARFAVSRLAELLETSCMFITVSDSDFAILELYGSDGKMLDRAAIGQAEADMPAPNPQMWMPLLNDRHNWEQFTAIQNSEYTFVEEALECIAPLFGMDRDNIMFDAADTDGHAVWVYFKKPEKTKEKKISVNAAFKQIFGEVLEPLGFVKAKTKIPYFLRAVSDEIIHIVGIRTHGTGLSIVSGAATVYRQEINFNRSQRYDSVWLHANADFYKYVQGYDTDYDLKSTLLWYGFRQNDTEDMLSAMRRALKDMQKWALPVLDAIRTTNDMMEYLLSMGGYVYPSLLDDFQPYPCSDGAMMLTLDDPFSFPEREKELHLQHALYEYEHPVNGIEQTEAQYAEYCARISDQYEKNKALLSRMLNDSEQREKVYSELQQRKIRNTETLRTYGLNIESSD